jgi:tRNA threonylcarbamoyladenosine biosynthesis protein TsaE
MADAVALRLEDELATAALGAALANVLHALATKLRDHGFSLGLRGDLGAGKTALVRALLRRFGVAGTVKSPTFSLLEPYELSRLHLYHFDFYRFKIPQEFEDRGFREYFAPGAVCLVEWPERAAGYLPKSDMTIALRVEELDVGENVDAAQLREPGRCATVEAHTELGRQCLQMLQDLWPRSSAAG